MRHPEGRRPHLRLSGARRQAVRRGRDRRQRQRYFDRGETGETAQLPSPYPASISTVPDVCDLAADLEPSERGELEITDLNRRYLEQNRLKVTVLDRGYAWLDAGTHRSLIEASTYIEAIEERQGLKIGCLQEIAWTKGWINNEEFRRETEAAASGSSYGTYLAEVLERAENKSAGG